MYLYTVVVVVVVMAAGQLLQNKSKAAVLVSRRRRRRRIYADNVTLISDTHYCCGSRTRYRLSTRKIRV